MEPTKPLLQPTSLAVTDVYTDLHGLQGLKNEENQDEALKKVAQQFESLFISMMMKGMRSANEVFESGNIFNSKESKFYRDMLDQQMSLSLSHGKGLGIAEVLYRQLSKAHGVVEEKQNGMSAEKITHEKTLFPKSNESAPIPLSNNAVGSSVNNIGSNASNERLFQNGYLGSGNLGIDILKGNHVENSSSNKTTIADNKAESITTKDEHKFDSPEAFIRGIYQYAKKAAEKLGIDTETIIAQSALETGWGQHIVRDSEGEPSHNLFNIKSGSQWRGDSIGKTVVEYDNGAVIKEQAQFRKYNTFEQSFDDYIAFISKSSRYNQALNSNTGDEYIKSLKDFGFATDPNYVEKVKNVRLKVVETLGNIAHDFFSQHLKGDL